MKKLLYFNLQEIGQGVLQKMLFRLQAWDYMKKHKTWNHKRTVVSWRNMQGLWKYMQIYRVDLLS